jgi:hypothetical protein
MIRWAGTQIYFCDCMAEKTEKQMDGQCALCLAGADLPRIDRRPDDAKT